MRRIVRNVIWACLISASSFAQITERERPKEWDQLVEGGRFVDRFLPMKGNSLSDKVWGASNVIPRYTDNGIEDAVWSYWGGNILKGKDGKYHMLVCGWLEGSPKGHMEWPRSYVFNAVSDNLQGPFKPQNLIGKGHNPEVYQLKDGRYVLYVIDGRYVANDLNGPWESSKFEFNPRDRKIIEGLSNLTFAKREDGSFVMICRGGGVWISKDGLDTYYQVSDKSVYPPVKGEFEDPVIWKDHIQYHLIVNDWLGRIAFYLRSKNGIDWVVDPGEAYVPGIAKHADGHKEDWFKYERLKVYQDDYGRAIQANFAVIDTLKHQDKPFDNHSSKNITIPLNKGLLMEYLDNTLPTAKAKYIRVKIKSEEGFNAVKDLDVNSLIFGANTEVNFGKGAKVVKTEVDGDDLIVYFENKNHGLTASEFAPKLIGKNKQGKMVYAYTRVPWTHYQTELLSTKSPKWISNQSVELEVSNFGMESSKNTWVEIVDERNTLLGKVALESIESYDSKIVKIDLSQSVNENQKVKVKIDKDSIFETEIKK